jgi:hypothetical protein
VKYRLLWRVKEAATGESIGIRDHQGSRIKDQGPGSVFSISDDMEKELFIVFQMTI